MDVLEVSIAEGKRNFTKIIRMSQEEKKEIIVSRRGNPVAVILPYERHIRRKKKEALMKIEEARAIYHRSEVGANETYEISKKELEAKK
jgi:prevent-host-death family protein